LTTASGTWTKPANITKIRVFVVGGGGGAVCQNSGTSTGGGGGGGTGVSVVDVTSISTVAYTISGDTTFSLATPIVGGQGGTATTANNDQDGSPGGVAGSATGADLIIPGGIGGTGRDNAGHGAGGVGGLSYISNYGRGSRGVSNHNNPTGGTLAGGGQTAGCIYIEEYSDPSLVSGGLGKLVKRVVTINNTPGSSTGNMPFDETQPLFSEGADLGMSTTYTPTSATNRLLIKVQMALDHTIDTSEHGIYLCKDGSDALTASMNQGTGTGSFEMCQLIYDVVAGSTAAATWTVRGGCAEVGRTLYWNRDAANVNIFGAGNVHSHLIIEEYTP
jgi:hypothetical protein